MKKAGYRYLFGPVPSRRFGRSLGIDLVPYKTCSFDCVFCQLGKTLHKTVKRKEYTPVDEVLAEIDDWLRTDGNADYITLSGSGEPTLHSGFGKILEFLQESTIPSVLLTNGTMMHIPEVRDSAALADVVKISLSAWNQRSLEWINRPNQQLRFNSIFEGQREFRSRYKGELWMEVFLISGMNSMPGDVEKIAAQIKEIEPDCIHLNTAVRPPAEDFAAALPKDRMYALTGLFVPPAEIIVEFNADYEKNIQANEKTILSMLQRRPCTIKQIGEVFGMHRNEVSKYLGKLLRANHIHDIRNKTEVYYAAVIKEDILLKNTHRGNTL